MAKLLGTLSMPGCPSNEFYGDILHLSVKEEKSYESPFLIDDIFKEWALCLNSPWSQVDETYKIQINCKDAYTERDVSKPLWKCTYTVVGYECIIAKIIGYGDTEIQALEQCKQRFKDLQNRFNPEGEYF